MPVLAGMLHLRCSVQLLARCRVHLRCCAVIFTRGVYSVINNRPFTFSTGSQADVVYDYIWLADVGMSLGMSMGRIRHHFRGHFWKTQLTQSSQSNPDHKISRPV